MIITAKLENVLKSFRVYANTRVSDPFDFTTEPQLLKKEFNVSSKNLFQNILDYLTFI